jgi:hypothetical protein
VKLLVLSQNQSYVNPSRRIFYDALARHSGVVFAGPGHSAGRCSIADLVARHGKFDAVFAELWAVWPGMPEPYASHRPADLFCSDIPVILSALQYDLHNLQEEFFAHAKSCAAVVTAIASPQFMAGWPPERGWREPWIDRESYALRHPEAFDERFVLMPHALAANEFGWTPWLARRHNVSLLGVGYRYRKFARAHMRARSVARTQFLDDPLQKALARLFVAWPKTMRAIGGDRIYHARFVAALRDSRLSVTCEGSLDYPIRKFFEIPAAGALLAARFFSFASELGFAPGENCLALDDNDPKTLDAALDFASSDSAEAEAMARRGHEAARAFHIDTIRVAQFANLVDAVASRSFRRARWRAGAFAVETI